MTGHQGLPRLLAGIPPDGTAMTLAAHEQVHGPLPRLSPTEIIERADRSGLRGRGGADFSTARKLRAVAQRGRASAVIVNGSETEPASHKDTLLLSRLPHLVLDGALIAAAAVGTNEVIVKVAAAHAEVVSALEAAIALRRDGRVRISLAPGPDGYVAGEESAVVNWLNGGAAKPVFTPPRPYERGYRRRPTLILNPETLAQLALVARFGADWFRGLGTAADPGSALVTVTGAVAAPGVYELAFGTSMHDLIAAAGGAVEPLRALLVGGYFGTWVDADLALGLRLAREDLRTVGCTLGSGVLVALGESSCGLHESARVMDWLADESAGQCGPCIHGLRAIADALTLLADGRGARDDRDRLLRWAAEVRGRGACHHPDGAARFVESVVDVFSAEIGTHRNGVCHAAAVGLPLAHAARAWR